MCTGFTAKTCLTAANHFQRLGTENAILLYSKFCLLFTYTLRTEGSAPVSISFSMKRFEGRGEGTKIKIHVRWCLEERIYVVHRRRSVLLKRSYVSFCSYCDSMLTMRTHFSMERIYQKLHKLVRLCADSAHIKCDSLHTLIVVFMLIIISRLPFHTKERERSVSHLRCVKDENSWVLSGLVCLWNDRRSIYCWRFLRRMYDEATLEYFDTMAICMAKPDFW